MKNVVFSALLIASITASCEVAPIDATPSDPNCICTMEYDPVCVKVDGVKYRYSNPCQAACDGFGEADFISCD